MFTDRQWAKMFTMKSEVVSHLYWVMDLVRNVDKKFVKDNSSQFQNFCMNFHEFHALFITRLSYLG
jgi:hypothetical protein